MSSCAAAAALYSAAAVAAAAAGDATTRVYYTFLLSLCVYAVNSVCQKHATERTRSQST